MYSADEKKTENCTKLKKNSFTLVHEINLNYWIECIIAPSRDPKVLNLTYVYEYKSCCTNVSSYVERGW